MVKWICIPGSRPNRRHITTSPHMNEPRSTLDRQAAHIAEEATIINLIINHHISLIRNNPDMKALTPQNLKVVVGQLDDGVSCAQLGPLNVGECRASLGRRCFRSWEH